MGKSSELHKNTQNSVLLGPPHPPKEKYPPEEAILLLKMLRKMSQIGIHVTLPQKE